MEHSRALKFALKFALAFLVIHSDFAGAQTVQPSRNIVPSSVYNTTKAWGSFFDAYPDLWTKITTALNDGATADLNNYANQVQRLFQRGFPVPDLQLNDATPGLQAYQAEARRGLLDIGLPGSAGISSSNSSLIVSYEIKEPFNIFVNRTGGLLVPSTNDPTWFLGPHTCLTRSSTFVQNPPAFRNVTYCTSTLGEGMMNVVCWLPTLAADGSALSGTRYTTFYKCCQGTGLPALPTAFPLVPFPSKEDLLSLADRVNLPDNRVCQ